METVKPQTQGVAPIARDSIAAHTELSWDELFGMDRTEVERFQLRSAQRRFEALRLENLASGHRLRKSSSYCHVKVAVCGAYSLRQFFDAYARGPGTDMFVRGIRPRVFR
jgi:hypothetical protein